MIKDGIKEENLIDSFAMMGQSNMAGRGHFNEVEEIVNNDAYMLRMGRWQIMSEPINVDRTIFSKNFHSGISLGASFLDEYAKKYKRKVGVIPCADGGTSILQWQPNEVLFEHAVMMIKLAMRSSNFKGILWHQGENDCCDEKRTEDYYDNFMNMYTQLKLQLNMPNLPIVIGEIPINIAKEYNIPKERAISFNNILTKIEKSIDNCVLVKTSDLPIQDDGIHFSAKALRVLGKRYFEGVKKLNLN